MGPAKYNYFEEDPYYEMMRSGRDMDRKPKVAPKPFVEPAQYTQGEVMQLMQTDPEFRKMIESSPDRNEMIKELTTPKELSDFDKQLAEDDSEEETPLSRSLSE